MFKLRYLFDANKWVSVFMFAALVGNIAGFMFLSPFCVLISNVITIIIVLVLYNIANRYINSLFDSQKSVDNKEIENLRDEKSKLNDRIVELTDSNNTLNAERVRLKNELDILKQYTAIKRDDRMVLKLETMEYEKEGYLVKEETVRDTTYGKDIKQGGFMSSDKGEQKVLFINKYHEKAIIGINLENIKFCKKGDKIYLEGVTFQNLHPEMKLIDDCDGCVSHCLILNTKDGEVVGLNDSDRYDDFRGWYTNEQKQCFLSSFKTDTDNICQQYTNVFKGILKKRFPQVEFVKDRIANELDLASCDVFFVKASNDLDIVQLSNSMVTISYTMNETMPGK